MLSKPTPKIIIVGAGTFGLSTGLHLLRQNHPPSQLLLLDRYPCPSPDAASNDSSRAIRPDYPDTFYARLGQEALQAWTEDNVFTQHFYKSGRLGVEPKGREGDGYMRGSEENLKQLGIDGIRSMERGDINERWKGLNGEMEGWNIYFNPEAGWANAREALKAAMAEYVRLGGNFLCGSQGDVVSVNYTESQPETVTGVVTADGKTHEAAKVLICAGAYTPQLIDTGTQIHPIGLCLAHWRLTPAELEIWKDHPVVDIRHRGYFFPPDNRGLMKMGVGATGYGLPGKGGVPGESKNVAVPTRYSLVPDQGIPKEAEVEIRKILREACPSLANKEFFDMKVCWDGMTPDSNWLITPHPTKVGLFIAGGGAGHAFKFLPNIGKYIVKMMEGTLSKESAEKWRWRAGHPDPSTAMQGRPIKDLKEALRPATKFFPSKL
ncbi:putative fructosyl amino acid oxidase [Tricladium varicosporioides]|nr:putative fructosyl amino acid oxidase [Hymenoscyphus varicosporioides]